jgi:hypothetical protein
MVYMPTYPSHIFFYCDVPPQEGGETPIILSNVVYEKINKEFPEFVKELKEKGIRYTRILPLENDPTSGVGLSWPSSFKTDSKEKVEEMCREGLYDKIEWLEDGSLKTVSHVFPATKVEKRTGKVTWFNQIINAYFTWVDGRNEQSQIVSFGDGTPFDPKVMQRCFQIFEDNCVSFKWQKGDMILVDNLLVLHARNTYKPPRRILVATFE